MCKRLITCFDSKCEICHLFAADEADFVAQWSALTDKPAIVEGLIIE